MLWSENPRCLAIGLGHRGQYLAQLPNFSVPKIGDCQLKRIDQSEGPTLKYSLLSIVGLSS